MNTRKSGLADSPFFHPAPLPASPPQAETAPVNSVQPEPPSVPVYIDAQAHERTVAPLNSRTDAPLHERTDTQTRNRSTAQAHEHTSTQLNSSTDAQPTRPRSRETYDVYEDQAQAIHELQLKWSKERRKYITKGQVMRELLDAVLPTKK